MENGCFSVGVIDNNQTDNRAGTGDSEFVVELDLGQVAHPDLFHIVDHVLVVLQGVSFPVLHGRAPKEKISSLRKSMRASCTSITIG